RDPARELAERRELLGLVELLLHLALRRDIADDRDQVAGAGRERDGEGGAGGGAGHRDRVEGAQRTAADEPRLGVFVVADRDDVADRPAERLGAGEAEDALGGG